MKLIRKIALAACSCVGAAALCGAILLTPQDASAEIGLAQPVALESEYAKGTELSIPYAQIQIGGVSYDTEIVLRYPNGEVSTASKVVLNQRGKYTLEYCAFTENGLEKVVKTFLVNEYLYSTDSRSSSSYGTYVHATSRPGLVTSLSVGEKFYFNQTIDLNGKTKDDSLVELFVTPKKQGLSDALNLIFTFTDIYDSENTVTVISKRLDREALQAQWQEVNLYTTANAAGQSPTGLERNGEGTVVLDGLTYKLHSNNIYGSSSKFAMAGIPAVNSDCSNIGQPTDVANQTLSVSMDYEQRRVYVNGALVVDLDEIKIFPIKQWEGFTTGECTLTISAASYNQDNFNMVITKLDDLAGEELSEIYIRDNLPPTLTVQYGEYENGFPDALVSKQYRVPEVVAYDVMDKYLDVTSKVYWAYGQNTQTSVKVTDGTFMPTKAGTYTIVYSATDYAGNTATLELPVLAKVVENSLELEIASADQTGKTGEFITVAEAEVKNAQGIAKYEIYAEYVNEAKGVFVRIPVAKQGKAAYTFCPLYAGEWTIVYEYSDYIESKVASYKVNVERNETPYIEQEVIVPKYLIQGATYTLPALYGYVFAEDGMPSEVKCTAYIKDDEKADRLLSGKGYTSYAKEYATLIYRLGEGENVAEKRYKIPVVDVNYDTDLSIKDYFIGDAFEKTAGSDRITLTTTETGTQSFVFANPVQVFDFKTVFHVPASANKYKRINVYLTDSEDANVTVKVSYIRNKAGNTTFTINDGDTEYISNADFVESNNENFRLMYVNKTRAISPTTAFSVEIKKDFNGNDFKGFASNKVYMTVELCEITGKSAIEFLNINNQPLSKITLDIIKPEISSSPIKGERYVGDKVVISATYMLDVLDPNIKCVAYVKTPSDKYAVATDGTVLKEGYDFEKDYTVIAEEYGSYTIYYACEDTNENLTIYSYVFTVKDVKAPEATLGYKVTTAKVGDTVVVANVIATDDSTGTDYIVTVTYPDGVRVGLKGNSFVATKAGEYTVLYLIYDENFNVTTLTYVINVTE